MRRTRTPYSCDMSERYHRQQISALVAHNSATGIWLYVYIYGVSVWVSFRRLMGSGIGMALVSRAWCKVLRQDTKRRTRTPYSYDISERFHRQQISALVAHKSATGIWVYVYIYMGYRHGYRCGDSWAAAVEWHLYLWHGARH